MKINNKSDKPYNIVSRDHEIIEKCISFENKLPSFMKDYFIYLKGSVAVSTRAAYLEDICFFFHYLVTETDICKSKEIKEITLKPTMNNWFGLVNPINYFRLPKVFRTLCLWGWGGV